MNNLSLSQILFCSGYLLIIGLSPRLSHTEIPLFIPSLALEPNEDTPEIMQIHVSKIANLLSILINFPPEYYST